MKVALTVIGRLENKYAVEFVEHYKQLGFDHLYIADNNYDGEEYFEDVLQQYINDQFVTIIDYRNKKSERGIISIQLQAYHNIYDKYCDKYDYMMFVDFDEFLILKYDNTIKEYLNRNVKNFDCILINWMVMTDNNLIKNDGRKLLERFDTPMNFDINASYENTPENYYVKPIIKCNKENKYLKLINPHTPDKEYTIGNRIRICNNNFQKIRYIDFVQYQCIKYDYTLAYIKHFSTKTIEEYIDIKMKRLTPDRSPEESFEKYNLDWFFKINEKTNKKIEYIKTKGIH